MGKKKRNNLSKSVDADGFVVLNDVFIPIKEQYPKNDFPCGLIMESSKGKHLNLEEDIHNAREAAEVHRQVRKWVKGWIAPGMKMTDIANRLENASKSLIGHNGLERGIAFPTGLSLNNCAAHWTPNPGDNTILKKDDVCKVDFGLHVNGIIIDSAFTLTFDEKYDKLLEASKEATMTGIKNAGPDVILGELGGDIQEVMESYEIELNGKTHQIKPISQLTGHSIQRYRIHAEKCVPSIKLDYNYRMENGEFYAIETFASTGTGKVQDGMDVSHYMFNYAGCPFTSGNPLNLGNYKVDVMGRDRPLFNAIDKNFGTLAFCRRWLSDLKIDKYQLSLRNLVNSKVVTPYPPLYDVNGSFVSQFEHTIVLNNDKKEVLSKGDDY